MPQQIALPEFLRSPSAISLKGLAIPEFVAKTLDTYEGLPPSEILHVTMELSPKAEEIGRGSPVEIRGKVTAFGLGIPMLVLIQAARSPERNLSPLALAISAPLTGAYAVQLDTQDWELGKYAFQALAIPPAGPPGVAPLHYTTLAVPRIGAQLVMSIQGAQSPLDAASGVTVFVDITLSNTGNVGLRNIVRKAQFQAGVGGTSYPAAPVASLPDTGSVLAPATSRSYANMGVSTAGMGASTYDALAWAEFNTDNAALPGLYWTETIRRVGEIRIVGYGGALTTVTWHL